MDWIEQLHGANWNQAAGVWAGGYLLGCLTIGYYLVKFQTGRDVREIGSGSVGAKNVARILGKGGYFLAALGDVGKGALAVWVTRHFTASDSLAALALLAAVTGHVWPAQLQFRGGKGVATTLGGLLIYDYRLALVFAVIFLCAFAVLRKTVLPGLFGIACVPFVGAFFKHSAAGITLLSALAALVLFAHRKNLLEEITQLFEHHRVQIHSDQS